MSKSESMLIKCGDSDWYKDSDSHKYQYKLTGWLDRLQAISAIFSRKTAIWLDTEDISKMIKSAKNYKIKI